MHVLFRYKLDHSRNYTVEIKNKIAQAKQIINALNSIWWSKNITKNKKITNISNHSSEHFNVWC